MNPSKRLVIVLSFSFLLSLAITACGFFNSQPDATPAPAPTPTPLPTVAPVSRALTVCLGQEPNTLYQYGGPNTAALSVLASIDDGPIDTVGYEYQPVILTRMPSLENGDAQIVSTPIQVGAQVVDADGYLVTLEQGTRVHPAGCRADDCIITYDGTTSLEMDQMIVDFHMRPNLTWADGTPLTSDDSVYSFTLASDPSSIADTFLIDRTQTYEATDELTLQWWGKPGFIDQTYFTNFWSPAPKHLWSQFTAVQLPTLDIASRTPVGWGPYMVEEWLAGDHITLVKNPYYFRAADGYPKFDVLSFRFISDPDTAMTEFVAGRCDILDPSIYLDNQASLLDEMQKGEEAQAFFTPGMTIEWLGVGTKPASYDDGYDPVYDKDRQDIFGDPHTREGIVYCLDRQSVVDNVLMGRTTVPSTYIPVAHPVYDPNIELIPFDPSVGISLLEQAGWKDTDGNPATPLVAVGVKNVKAGTPLLLNYQTTTTTQRRQVVDILTKSLAECQVGLNVQYLSQNDLYAPGPEGPLFGRNFDLIEYAMGVEGVEPPCNWFIGAEIPAEYNLWTGMNVTAYANGDYDTACHAAMLAMPNEQSYSDLYRQTQVLFSDALPAIPLFYRLRISAAAPDICHYDLDATANPLWNIEAIDRGEACQN